MQETQDADDPGVQNDPLEEEMVIHHYSGPKKSHMDRD